LVSDLAGELEDARPRRVGIGRRFRVVEHERRWPATRRGLSNIPLRQPGTKCSPHRNAIGGADDADIDAALRFND
jgi:hypothetical protein